MKKIFTSIGLFTLIVTQFACTSTAEKNNPILAYSENTKKLGETWEKGNTLVQEGQALIDKGSRQIKEGEKNLEKGLQMKEKGQTMLEASESQFNQLLEQKSSTFKPTKLDQPDN